MAATKTTDDTDVIAPTPTEIAQPPFVPVTTIEDPNHENVRRLLPSPDPGYRPAPVDPSDKDVERAEQRIAREEAEAAGESYTLPDGTEVQTTPEGKAEAEAKAEEDAAKAEQKAEATAAKADAKKS